MSNNEEIAQFISVTGAPPEAAAFYLDSAKGNVAAAVDAFFSSDGALPPAQPEAAASDEPLLGSRPQATPKPISNPPQASGMVSKPRRAPASGANKIKSLSDLNRDEDESEEDESNEYYAGGEKSGQVVKGGDSKKNRVESLFDRARQAGAEMGTAADLEAPGSSLGGSGSAFRGRARTLGGSGEDRKDVEAEPEAPSADQPVVHTITFWANNVFTIDHGEPREVLDPANRPFLEAIGRGECPPELLPENPDTPINVNMVRKDTEYQAPAQPRHVAFAGKGRTLTGNEPSGGGGAAPSTSQPAPSTGPDVKWEGVDASRPTTSIQLRLADGSRMVAQFNHGHAVGDIRRFIAASRPDMSPSFSLMTAFPSAQLTDNSKTILEAGLLNAVIIQKL